MEEFVEMLRKIFNRKERKGREEILCGLCGLCG
jgi:hypothetical protein